MVVDIEAREQNGLSYQNKKRVAAKPKTVSVAAEYGNILELKTASARLN
jgi:hypothetical protein